MKSLRLSELPRWLRDIAPLLFWMGLIFWLSSRSGLIEIEGESGEKLFYKSAHVIAYAVLAWLWWRALTRERVAAWSTLLAALTLTILYGISDEIHQLFVPGRHGQLTDVLYDAGGALLMLFFIRRLTWLRTFPENLFLATGKSEGKSSTVVSSQ